MKSPEMTMLFRGSNSEAWMKAFYDMSMKDACQISGVSQSALKRLRDAKGMPTWPFQGLKQGGEVNSMLWEEIRRHRETLVSTRGLPEAVRTVLLKAKDWGRLQRKLHDPSYEEFKQPREIAVENLVVMEEVPVFPEVDPVEWSYLYPGDEEIVFE